MAGPELCPADAVPRADAWQPQSAHTTAAMAPCPVVSESPEDRNPSHQTKRRKPVVEKMRRDRINTCIEQLRRLLEEEIQKQQPQCRLEKADILEITVAYLEQQRQHQLREVYLKRFNSVYHHQGYSKCLRETIGFLSAQKPQSEMRVKVMGHFLRDVRTFRKQQSPVQACPASSPQALQKQSSQNSSKTLWRPW